jgi:hypothetical protein
MLPLNSKPAISKPSTGSSDLSPDNQVMITVLSVKVGHPEAV